MSKTSAETALISNQVFFIHNKFSSRVSFLQPKIRHAFMILQWVMYFRTPARSHMETSAL